MAEQFILNRRLYTDASRLLILEDGDTRAAFLIGGAGSIVLPEDVARFGLDESHRLTDEPATEIEAQADPESNAADANDHTITTGAGFQQESKRHKRVVKSR